MKTDWLCSIALAALIATASAVIEPSTGPPMDGQQVEVEVVTDGIPGFTSLAFTTSDVPEPPRFAIPAPMPFEPGFRESRRVVRRSSRVNPRGLYKLHNTNVTSDGKIFRIT